jgi:MSHA biogenesis protein MshK
MPPASMAAPVAEAVAVVKPAGLQSILISKHRRAAIIDGETVELGGIHGAAKLIEVNEGNVVLRGAQGRQVLSLFPDVSKISQKSIADPAQSGSKVDAKILNTHSRREKK